MSSRGAVAPPAASADQQDQTAGRGDGPCCPGAAGGRTRQERLSTRIAVCIASGIAIVAVAGLIHPWALGAARRGELGRRVSETVAVLIPVPAGREKIVHDLVTVIVEFVADLRRAGEDGGVVVVTVSRSRYAISVRIGVYGRRRSRTPEGTDIGGVAQLGVSSVRDIGGIEREHGVGHVLMKPVVRFRGLRPRCRGPWFFREVQRSDSDAYPWGAARPSVIQASSGM